MKVSKTGDRRGGESANRLDWTVEVAGRLELQLVGHRMDLETIEPGHKLVGGPLGPVLRVHHEEHVRETGVICCFSLAAFNICSLYLIYDSLINMCLSVFLLGFIL